MSMNCVQHMWERTTASIRGFAQMTIDSTLHVIRSTDAWLTAHRPLFERVRDIALPILLAIGGTILFAAQSSMFVIGVFVSIMNPAILQGALGRISSIWRRQHIISQCLIVAGAAMAWPISLAAASFFLGGHVGLSLLPHEDQTASEGERPGTTP